MLAYSTSLIALNTSILSYFDRVESLLRQSLGVSLSARGSASYKPAPPIAAGPLQDEDVESTFSPRDVFGGDDAGQMGDAQFEDWQAIKDKLGKMGGEGMKDEQLEELFGEGGVASTHDEL